MFILWALTAGFLQFGYYGVNNWMPSYLESELGMKFKEMTAYMVGTYTAMILGKVLAGMMADKLGRRFTYAFGAIGTAIFLPLIVFITLKQYSIFTGDLWFPLRHPLWRKCNLHDRKFCNSNPRYSHWWCL